MIVVTRHAAQRYLERYYGVPIDAVGTKIQWAVQRIYEFWNAQEFALPAPASLAQRYFHAGTGERVYVSDEHVFLVADNPDGRRARIVTYLPAREDAWLEVRRRLVSVLFEHYKPRGIPDDVFFTVAEARQPEPLFTKLAESAEGQLMLEVFACRHPDDAVRTAAANARERGRRASERLMLESRLSELALLLEQAEEQMNLLVDSKECELLRLASAKRERMLKVSAGELARQERDARQRAQSLIGSQVDEVDQVYELRHGAAADAFLQRRETIENELASHLAVIAGRASITDRLLGRSRRAATLERQRTAGTLDALLFEHGEECEALRCEHDAEVQRIRAEVQRALSVDLGGIRADHMQSLQEFMLRSDAKRPQLREAFRRKQRLAFERENAVLIREIAQLRDDIASLDHCP